MFEAMWVREAECKEIVDMAWNLHTEESAMPIQERIKRCQSNLKGWNQNKFRNVNKNLKQKQDRLQQLESLNMLHNTTEEISAVRMELNELHTREEIKWNQRSQVLWLQNGDRNTEFFHASASQRQRKNRIGGLMDEGGIWQEEQGATEKIILEYFSSIFSSDHPSNFGASLEAVSERVTPEMNNVLLGSFKADEVWQALQQMHPTKSPGPDGMSPIFYQKYWNIVGLFVSNCVLQALNTGVMPKDINNTYICLISKIKNPQKITNYRPISLCNVIYKLISKVLENRLKRILNEVITDAQSAFVLGHHITDNVVVAFETMHTIGKRKNGKEGLMAIKLNMSKAYDRVEWGYLEAIMRKMGFRERWISLVMMCVTTVSY